MLIKLRQITDHREKPDPGKDCTWYAVDLGAGLRPGFAWVGGLEPTLDAAEEALNHQLRGLPDGTKVERLRQPGGLQILLEPA